jgi:hypothetical protein
VRKKWFVMLALALTLSLAASGCIDLFSVPGVAVSPDGTRLYFLSGEDEGQGALVAAPLGGAIDATLFAGSENDTASAFGVNPVTGEIAYIRTSETGGTSLEIYSPADGSTRQLLGPAAFGAIGIGTLLRYSPDGGNIGVTMVMLPPDIRPTDLQSEKTNVTPEQLAQVRNIAYVVDVNAAALTAISNPESEGATTLAWSPSGSLVAYSAWVDANGDGTIVTFPAVDQMTGDTGDQTHVFLHDLTTGATTALEMAAYDYAPVFLSNDALAYVAVDPMSQQFTIKVFDLADGVSSAVYQTANLIPGVALSPAGDRVAWIESPSDMESSGDEQSPSFLYVAGADFSNPRQVKAITEVMLPDAPIWLPDGQSVLVMTTNLFAGLLSSFTASIDLSFSTDSMGEATPEVSVDMALPPVLKVNVDTGETTTVYEGLILNSNSYSSVIGLTASGALEDMMGGMAE